ncbi:MAG TPA: hypothetical protein VF218_02700 [Acidothermaceae bacterium]
MADADAQFREFAAAFGEPLTRVAHLLQAGLDPAGDAQRDERRAGERVVRSLAQVRRHWREASDGGSPEAFAVEALLSRLPRASSWRRLTPARCPKPDPSQDLDQDLDEDLDQGLDQDLLLDRVWQAWKGLSPRERVALLFADAGVASRQLDGLAFPDTFASPRRLRRLENSAWRKLGAQVSGDRTGVRLLAKLPPTFLEDNIGTLVRRMLNREAAKVTAPVDAYPRAAAVAARVRRRVGLAVAAVAVLAVGATTAVSVSTSRHPAKTTAGATSTASQSASPASAFVANSDERVVDWPVRGELRGDTDLLANLRSAFVANHPDAIGDVQILLATDTSAFRLAYVTAHSRQGVIRSWYFGPVGARQLTEGSFSYGGNLLHGSVIAAALADPEGHSVLVVIGPPETNRVLLSEVRADNFLDASFSEIGQRNGIVVRDVSQQYLPSLFLKLFEGEQLGWNRPVPVVQLGKREPDLPPVTVQRGEPDPAVLAQALRTEADWARTGELSAGGQAVVLWGGKDSGGEPLVVLRVRTLHLADLLIVAWSDGDGQYLLQPDLPDYPIGFAYPTKTGARVGVLTAPGVAFAELVEDGVATGSQRVDATGFASLQVNRPYPDLALRTFVVRLFDAAGHQVSEVTVPPQV